MRGVQIHGLLGILGNVLNRGEMKCTVWRPRKNGGRDGFYLPVCTYLYVPTCMWACAWADVEGNF